MQIAGDGDNPHDPSDEWPDDRQRVTVGTLEVTAVDDNADDGIIFDPMRLTDGIEQVNEMRWSPDGQWIWHNTISYGYCQTCDGHQYAAAARL